MSSVVQMFIMFIRFTMPVLLKDESRKGKDQKYFNNLVPKETHDNI
jgi:hypothetical protein